MEVKTKKKSVSFDDIQNMKVAFMTETGLKSFKDKGPEEDFLISA